MTTVARASTVTLPRDITPDNLSDISDVDDGHRYELTAEGILQVMSPANITHTKVVTRLLRWLIAAGYAEVHVEAGIAIGGGVRGPDIALFSTEPRAQGAWASPAGLQLVVEVLSPSTKRVDLYDKVREYAEAGVVRYWTVDPEAGAVVMRRLDGEGHYRGEEPVLLDWLLAQDPHRYLGDVET